jgi:general secretion pathway protein L
VAEHLFLRLGDSADRVAVARLTADGQLLSQPETIDLAAAAARCDGALVTVLLPAREVVSCTAALPATNVSRQRQMLPFSLEDEFAGDVDELHFALGSSIDAGTYAVSVIERHRLDHWLTVLGAAGISTRRMFSEADGVADTPGATTLFLENRRIFGRRPGGAPFSFDELGLPEVWQLLQSERAEQADLGEVVLFVDSDTLRSRGDEIDAWRAGVANVSLKELPDGALPRLAATLVFREGPNLLQGRYAPKSNYASLLRPWRVAAMLALAVVAFAIVGKAVEAWKLKRNDDQLNAAIEAICSASYGVREERPCQLEMQRRLAGSIQGGGSGTGFLETLAAVASASGDAARIDGLRFSENVMVLDLIVPSFSFFDTFKEGVTAAGAFDVRMVSNTDQGDDMFKLRLNIVSANP